MRPASVKNRMRHSFVWMTVPVAVVMAVAAGAGMVLAGTDVGIIAVLERSGRAGELGWVFLAWCAASMVGGLLYGAMHRTVSPLVLLLLMAVLTIPMGFAGDTLTLSLLSVAPGLLCAPVLSAASEKVAELVDEDRRGEAMGWYGSALTSGVALGAPTAGILIDVVGPWGGFAAVGSAAALLSLAGLAVQRVRRRRVGKEDVS